MIKLVENVFAQLLFFFCFFLGGLIFLFLFFVFLFLFFYISSDNSLNKYVLFTFLQKNVCS